MGEFLTDFAIGKKRDEDVSMVWLMQLVGMGLAIDDGGRSS